MGISSETILGLGAGCEDQGVVEVGDVLNIDNVDAEIEEAVVGVAVEDFGERVDGVVVHLLMEIKSRPASLAQSLVMSSDALFLVGGHDAQLVLVNPLQQLVWAIKGEALHGQLIQARRQLSGRVGNSARLDDSIAMSKGFPSA